MDAYKMGVEAGREGRKPSVPTSNALIDPLFFLTEEKVEKAAEQYREGYSAGSQQRAADKSSKKG